MQKAVKNKGYQFDSTVLGIVKNTSGDDRVIAQIDTTEAEKFVHELRDKYSIGNDDFAALLRYITNCDGMIHIFAPEQLRIYGEKE